MAQLVKPKIEPFDPDEPFAVPPQSTTFSEVVDTCLDDIKNVSNLWYPLVQSENVDTQKTLAGLAFKALLNNSLKQWKTKKQVEKIIKESELIDLAKVRYLEDHPDIISLILKTLMPQLNEQPLTLELHKTKCRLFAGRLFFAETPISTKFKWPLIYTRLASEFGLLKFRIRVKEEYQYRKNKSRDEVLKEFLKVFKKEWKSINGSCTAGCYHEKKLNDRRSTVTFTFAECTNRNHNKYSIQRRYATFSRILEPQMLRLGRREEQLRQHLREVINRYAQ